VAAHEVSLNNSGSGASRPVAVAPVYVAGPPAAPVQVAAPVQTPATAAVAVSVPAAAPELIPAFGGLDQAGVIALIASAIESNTLDLFLQPIVTLPQRKVRYYEALSRLKADSGEMVAAADFLK